MWKEEFDLIYSSDDVGNITNITTLRHYQNIHGFNDKVCARFNVDAEKLSTLCDIAEDDATVEESLANFDTLKKAYDDRANYLRNQKKYIDLLHKMRECMCGIGTKKVKILLNKKDKEGGKNAILYRTALEIEDKNVSAKETDWYYRDKVYNEKNRLISTLVDLCKSKKIVYGIQTDNNVDTNCVIYFELPKMKQISFLYNPVKIEELPSYEGKYDGKDNSILNKIEDTVSKVYAKDIEDIKKKDAKKKDKEKEKTANEDD